MADGEGSTALALINQHIAECAEHRRSTETAITRVNTALSDLNKVGWGGVVSLIVGLAIAAANLALSYHKGAEVAATAQRVSEVEVQSRAEREARDRQILEAIADLKAQQKGARHAK